MFLGINGLRLGFSASGGGAGSAGITVVETQSAVILGGGGSETFTFAETLEEDDFVFVFATIQAVASAFPVPAGYSAEVNTSTQQPRMHVFYKKMGATPDTEVIVDGEAVNNLAATAIVQVYRGVDPANPFDVTTPTPVTVPTNQTSVTPPPITTVTDGALVIGYAGLEDRGGNAFISYPAGYTNGEERASGGSFNHSAIASRIVETAGTETMGAFVFAGSDRLTGVTLALRPA